MTLSRPNSAMNPGEAGSGQGPGDALAGPEAKGRQVDQALAIRVRENVVRGLQTRCIIEPLIKAQRHLGPWFAEGRAAVPWTEDHPVDDGRHLDTAAPGVPGRQFEVEASAVRGQFAWGAERHDGAAIEAVPLVSERDPVGVHLDAGRSTLRPWVLDLEEIGEVSPEAQLQLQVCGQRTVVGDDQILVDAVRDKPIP